MIRYKKLKSVIAVVVSMIIVVGIITPVYADDYAGKLKRFDYYYITDEKNKGVTLKLNEDGSLDEAYAYEKLGKNYIDDMETWSEMALKDYGHSLEQRDVSKAKVTELANSFNYGSTYEKYKRIFDYIVANVPYDHSFSKNSYTVYGCLIDHLAICEGNAKAYKAIADAMGLPCYLRTSRAENHAWNAILLDGEWYVCDTTAKSFAEDPSEWYFHYRNEEHCGLNADTATSALNEYIDLTYANHGYATSSEAVTEESNEPTADNTIVESITEEGISVTTNNDNSSNNIPEEIKPLKEDEIQTNEIIIAENETTINETETASNDNKDTVVTINVPATSNEAIKQEKAQDNNIVKVNNDTKTDEKQYSIPLTIIAFIIIITVLAFILYIIIRVKKELIKRMYTKKH